MSSNLFEPTELSKQEYSGLLEQIQELSLEDCRTEWLDAARYNDPDAARALLQTHEWLLSHQSPENGNSALHMAAANGHTEFVEWLLLANANPNLPNHAQNTPLHWAATNGQEAVVQVLLKQNVDVLQRNVFGRSSLTEGFTSENANVVQHLLEHESATEERLMETTGASSSEASITHEMMLGSVSVRIRELAMAHNSSDSILGQERPEDDTTGLSVWAASIVTAQWMSRQEDLREGPRILELGAGCGLPSIVLAKCCPAATIVATDLNLHTVTNLRHNLELNDCSNASARILNWKDTGDLEPVDFIVGSDLIYQSDMASLLESVVQKLLRRNATSRMWYVAPTTGRQGHDEFVARMSVVFDIHAKPAPKSYSRNPLKSQDDEEAFLHFHELGSTKFTLFELRWKRECYEL